MDKKNKKKNIRFMLGNTNSQGKPNNMINSTTPNQPKNYGNLNTFVKNHQNEIKKSSLKSIGNLHKKILILYACHTNNPIKSRYFHQNFNFLSKIPNSDLVVINSKDIPNVNVLENYYKNLCLKYFTIHNNKFLDFGKWLYGLENINLSGYHYITFVNDSIVIEKPIDFYFTILRSKNFDLYGFNNSTQTRLHIQTYLFSIKQEVINKFKNFIKNSGSKINNNQESVIMNLEVKLTDIYPKYKNFINTRQFPEHKGKNIFFNHDFLFFQLKKNGLFPFFKIKRIKN